MKTIILTTALVVLTAVSFAQKNSENGQEMKSENAKVKVAMYSNVSDQVTFIVMKQPEDKLNLKIKDEDGSLVYEKRLRRPENRKITFDIKSLPKVNTLSNWQRERKLYIKILFKRLASIALSK